jgi:hypothetical protein
MPLSKLLKIKPNKQLTSPFFQLKAINYTKNNLMAAFFRCTQYLTMPNHGSSIGVKVEAIQNKYTELLLETIKSSLNIEVISFASSNYKQLISICNQVESKHNVNFEKPLGIFEYISIDGKRMFRVDVPVDLKIDENTTVQFKLLGETAVTLTFFNKKTVYKKYRKILDYVY